MTSCLMHPTPDGVPRPVMKEDKDELEDVSAAESDKKRRDHARKLARPMLGGVVVILIGLVG